MDEKIKNIKSNKYKMLAAAGILTTVLYVGDAMNIGKNISGAFTGVKNGIVDIFTTDVGEASSDLLDKLKDTKNIIPYTSDVQKVAYLATKKLPSYEKRNTLISLVNGADKGIRYDIINNTVKNLDAKEKGRLIRRYVPFIELEDSKAVYMMSKKRKNDLEPGFFDNVANKFKGLYEGVKKKLSKKDNKKK